MGSPLRRSISIIIPAYNEDRRLPSTLAKIQRYLRQSSWDFAEIVVVDDGSRDATKEVARRSGARLIANPGNRGKGYTVRQGMLEARGEWALFSDADLSSPIEELDKLWSAAEREQAAVAIGSRALDRSLIGVPQPFFRDRVGRTGRRCDGDLVSRRREELQRECVRHEDDVVLAVSEQSPLLAE